MSILDDTESRRESSGQSVRPVNGAVPPRSAGVATLVAGIALLAIAVATGSVTFGGIGLLLGVALGVGIATVDSPRFRRTVLGGGLVLGGTAMAVALPAYALGTGSAVGAGLGAAGALVGLGVACFRLDAFGEGAISRAIAWILRVTLVVGIVALLLAVVRLDIARLVSLGTAIGPVEQLLNPTTGTGSGLGFLVLAWSALAGVWLVVFTLPPATIFEGTYRRRYQRIQSRVLSVAVAGLGGGSILLAVLYVISTEATLGGTVDDALMTLVESQAVRTIFVRILLVGILLAVLIRVARSIGVVLLFDQPAWFRSGLVVGSGIIVAAIIGAHSLLDTVGTVPVVPLETGTELVGTATVGVVLAAVGLLAIAASLMSFPLLAGLNILPARTAGPRLVLAGLLVASVAAAGNTASIVVLLSAIAAAVVWDVAEYGVGLTTAVGPRPARRDGELVHAGVSLLVGAVSFVGIGVLQWLLSGIQFSDSGLVMTVLLSTFAVIVVTLLLPR